MIATLEAAFDRLAALARGPLLVALCAGALVGAMALLRSEAEPYTFDHVKLNRRKGESGRPKTEWMNMSVSTINFQDVRHDELTSARSDPYSSRGYWRETDVFPDACRALARKVLDAAHLCEGGHHLDVAHGSGDSLLLVLDRTAGPAAYPPQTSITGITSMAAHSQRAKERVAMAKPQDDNESSVRLVCGDAIFRPGSTGSDKHPFAPASKGRYTSIICLDAAYHFVTRHTFLSQAFEALAPGGTLALGDNLSSASYPTSTPTTWALTCAKRQPSAPSPVARLLLPRLLPLLSVPAANIVPLPELAQQLLDLGFEDVAIEDVSEDVWPGFATFLRQRGLLWRAAGWTIDWLGGSGGLRWVIVRARRPADVVER